MKKVLLSFFLIFLFSGLTACTTINGGCGKRYGCCQTTVTKYPCKQIRDRCEAACDACNFNDPACTMCWNCINYDGCVGPCKNCR